MKSKTVFYCTDCGNETPKWQGQCSACGSWNTIVEHKNAAQKKGEGPISVSRRVVAPATAIPLSELDTAAGEIRFSTGISELDRVLGGGAVKGSLVLVGGAPGVGKSTLLLQICGNMDNRKILYVSGEESQKQLKMRADRLGVSGVPLYVLAETNLDEITDNIESLSPDVLVIDSIQTLYNPEVTASPGSITQVKACTMNLMQIAKGRGVTIFVIGHVNKDGDIAGPRVLEHMVDCVLYFEGDSNMSHRILRAAKNRFGSTNEIGVFEMSDKGLDEVKNPSELLLSGRPENTPGTCVTCVMEGTRPVLAEIQALLTPTSFNLPRRTTNGVDYNRAMLLMAVLEKRGGLHIGGCDAYINVVGGLHLGEPSIDLAEILAIASSYRDKALDSDLVVIGEVGLTGEVRTIASVNQRLAEIRRLGFSKCILPIQNSDKLVKPDGLKLTMVRTIRDALKAAMI